MNGSGLGPGGRLKRRGEIHLENNQVQMPRIMRQALVGWPPEMMRRVSRVAIYLVEMWRDGIERRLLSRLI